MAPHLMLCRGLGPHNVQPAIDKNICGSGLVKWLSFMPQVAYKQNGRWLTPDHGFPVRMIIPGHIGGRMVKWLTVRGRHAQLARLVLAPVRATDQQCMGSADRMCACCGVICPGKHAEVCVVTDPAMTPLAAAAADDQCDRE